jgi:hypothetical protein
VSSFDGARDNVPIPNEQGDKKLRGVLLVNRFDDATVVYTGVVSPKRKDVRTATLWKYPPTIDAQTALERAAANLTPETLGGMDANLAECASATSRNRR